MRRGRGGRFVRRSSRSEVIVMPRRRRRSRRSRRTFAGAVRRARYPRGGRRAARAASLSRRGRARLLGRALMWGGLGTAAAIGVGGYALASASGEDYAELGKKTGASWLAWVGAVFIGVGAVSRTLPARFFWASAGAALLGSEVIRQTVSSGPSDFALRWLDDGIPEAEAERAAAALGATQRATAAAEASEAQKRLNSAPRASLDLDLGEAMRELFA